VLRVHHHLAPADMPVRNLRDPAEFMPVNDLCDVPHAENSPVEENWKS
jgi:hypothetical protein